MYGYKILRLSHTCMQRHSLSAFAHVVLWVSAIILQTGTQWRGTTWSDNDANTFVLLIRPWTMWQLQSTHLYIKTWISFSFTGDKIRRNLLRQTDEPRSNTFWRYGDWLCPHLQGDSPENGERVSLRNFLTFLNFDAAVSPRRLHWATKLVF